VFTSRRWQSASPTLESRAGEPTEATSSYGRIRRLALVTCILTYLQIVLGAIVRHVPASADPATFMHAVRFHLFLAAVLTLHIGLLVWLVLRHARRIQPLAMFASMLAALVTLQLVLGAGTWIVKFSLPAWARDWIAYSDAAIQDGGWLQTHVITAHVAVGSLVLVTSLALALYAQRMLPACPSSGRVASHRWEAAV
jgi:cytochrome c oxidase assembly protein subunit 15